LADDALQKEARALGDPTRHRLFRYIADAPGPVGVAELTEYVGLNHNAVRQHLALLKDAELVVEEVEDRSRPGRPRLLYRVHPEAAGRWDTTSAYAWLGRLLADAITLRRGPRQIGRQEGHRRAAELSGTGRGVELLNAEMARLGFRPAYRERGPRVEYVLGRCPFADVADVHPETVCQLHVGLAEGLAEGFGDVEVEQLVIKNPHRAGCRLVVRPERVPASA
jgi:predicted ArsR family transcriptional regulator